MHPGPMNRGVEIDPRVADSGVSLITEQVRAGLVVRMAVLYDLLVGGPAAARRWRSNDASSRPARPPAPPLSPSLRRASRLFWPGGPGDSLTIRGARVVDPVGGRRRAARRHDRGRGHHGGRADRRGRPRARARACLRRPARAPPRPGPRGRGDDRDGDGGGRGGRLLRHPRRCRTRTRSSTRRPCSAR